MGGRKWKGLPAAEVSFLCAPLSYVRVCIYALHFFRPPNNKERKKIETRKLPLDYNPLVVFIFLEEAISFYKA